MVTHPQTPDPIEDQIPEVRKKSMAQGFDNLTERECQILLADWQHKEFSRVAQALEKFTGTCPLFSEQESKNGKGKRKVEIVKELAVPPALGAGVLAIILKILETLR